MHLGQSKAFLLLPRQSMLMSTPPQHASSLLSLASMDWDDLTAVKVFSSVHSIRALWNRDTSARNYTSISSRLSLASMSLRVFASSRSLRRCSNSSLARWSSWRCFSRSSSLSGPSPPESSSQALFLRFGAAALPACVSPWPFSVAACEHGPAYQSWIRGDHVLRSRDSATKPLCTDM